ncbi:MAG: hypothetical protein ACE5M4_14555, partial [Anaerolineales bacterium]
LSPGITIGIASMTSTRNKAGLHSITKIREPTIKTRAQPGEDLHSYFAHTLDHARGPSPPRFRGKRAIS